MLLEGVYKGEVGFASEGPKVGDPAPGFRLETVDGSKTVALADVQKAKKPVVLIFGSFT
jgi:peroxiredoxin